MTTDSKIGLSEAELLQYFKQVLEELKQGDYPPECLVFIEKAIKRLE
jgi:hypothetical protein